MISRRHFLSIATAAVIVLPELIVPKRTFFLPPQGGWHDSGWHHDNWYLATSRYNYVVLREFPPGPHTWGDFRDFCKQNL